MMGKIVWVLLVLLVQLLLAIDALTVDRLNIWPMPKSVSYGHGNLYMSKDFELNTQGTKYNDGSGILKDGFSRFLDLVRVAHVEDGNFSKIDTSVLLQGLHVVVLSASDEVVFLFHELVVVLAWCFYVGFDFLLLLSQSSCIGIWHWIIFFFFSCISPTSYTCGH